MRPLRIIYASTSGHTEFVVEALMEYLNTKDKTMTIRRQRAEEAKAEDLTQDDVLILASSTWNTGSVEGQLNPHMHELLLKRAKDIDLKEKYCCVIALGDERYYYTARAGEYLAEFIASHHGTQLMPPLKIVNEPYGQEERMHHWADELLQHLKKLPPPASAIE